ncbi:MAG: lasso RiPP family leader peptide-containing protein [Anaerolineales bacterium]|nr:lasso RiPP family leader peptide-containing protein [Anaerolineales bacterium]
METKDMIDNEKKVYATPELVEHGDLGEMTQGGAGGDPETLGGTNPEGKILP